MLFFLLIMSQISRLRAISACPSLNSGSQAWPWLPGVLIMLSINDSSRLSRPAWCRIVCRFSMTLRAMCNLKSDGKGG